MTKLVEYYVTDAAINIFTPKVGDAVEPTCIRVPYSYSTLRDQVLTFRQALLTRGRTDPPGRELRRVLVQPLYDQGLLAYGDALVIAPHRCLHSMPFQALGDHDGDMLANHVVTYIPTARMSRALSPSVKFSRDCLVIRRSSDSDSEVLRGSFEREANLVAGLMRGALLSGSDATPANIARNLTGRSTVHFTCHGTFIADAPQRSGLLLAGDDGRDNLCDIDALGRMPFDVDLVVLAACETGLSEDHPGDELLGLVRALTVAGARAVLATLWPVHTLSTELVVKKFYSELCRGTPPAEALRLAQLHVRTCIQSEIAESIRQELESCDTAMSSSQRLLLRERLAAFATRSNDEEHVSKYPEASIPLEDSTPSEELPYRHPYFWAPFVLIGGAR